MSSIHHVGWLSISRFSRRGGFRRAWLGHIRVGRAEICALLLACMALGAVQCSGGGSGGGTLDVVEFSATLQSPRVYLNDEIVIEFTQGVDPQTVFSGIFIYPSVSAGAKRAQGQWRVEGKLAIFTPNLPTNTNYNNGGLIPNTEYTICVPKVGQACSVHIQNVPGLRSTSGRGMSVNRLEKFLTVDLQTQDPFRPELAPQRPTIARVDVVDAKGVAQQLNPITNLYSNVLWEASVLTTLLGRPPTQPLPPPNPTSLSVPRYEWTETKLTKTVSSDFAMTDVITNDPLTITMRNPNQPIVPGEFEDAGGVLFIRDSSNPPVEARWAIDTNTARVITAKANSGRDISMVPFQTPPLFATIQQGITRQVAPGDSNDRTAVKITFNEPISPPLLSSFVMYKVSDTPQGLQFDVIPPESTLVSSPRQGITHEVINDQSVVTLLPKASFPQSKPNAPSTVVVWMATAQLDNAADPVRKFSGIRDLNDFPLAYPVKSGWLLEQEGQSLPKRVGYIEGFEYTNQNVPAPGNIQTMWGFQTRSDTVALNAIVEDFADQANLATGALANNCPTTAAWTKANSAGLYSTYGYGGNGELGDETIAGSKTLDSSTGTPGPDGFVTYNYNRLEIKNSGNLVLMGDHPIRINSVEKMIVEGTIDASGVVGQNAPAGTASSVGQIPGGRGGPGGGDGGIANQRPNDPLGSLPSPDLRGGPGWPKVQNNCGEDNRSANRLITVIETNCGGGTGGNRGTIVTSLFRDGCSGNGGGHNGDGQQTDFECQNLQGFGKEHGVQWAWTVGPGHTVVSFPTAGSGGGAGGNAQLNTTANATNDICAGSGGGGGGGLELVSADEVVIKSSGQVLSVGGNGGQGHSTVVGSTTVSGGWGAGGAGGSVWLSGTSVTVESGGRISAIGGTGNPNPTVPGRGGDGGLGYNVIRDLEGSPTVNSGAIVTPTYVATLRTYKPAVNGLSVAYSAFYDSGTASPNWTFDGNNPLTGQAQSGKDLDWGTPPQAGQSVIISFQGAPDQNGAPNPDPSTWFPAGNTLANPCAAWVTDISQIKNATGMRYIRFRIQFDIGERKKNATPPSRVSIRMIKINYPDV